MEKEIVDVSWMWHCSSTPENTLDYNALDVDPKMAKALNYAVASGFRLALRRLEDLNIIEMGDIDRPDNKSDQETWDIAFKNEE